MRRVAAYEPSRPHALLTASVQRAVFFPAVWLCASIFVKANSTEGRFSIMAVALFQPAAILIDHGHFQYNNLGLGLSVSTCLAHTCVRSVLIAQYDAYEHVVPGSCGSTGGDGA